MRKLIIHTVVLMLCLSVIQASPGHALENPSENAPPLVTLEYKDASLATVLRALSQSYDLNLVIAKDISGNVSINLKDVPLEEALEALLEVHGYGFERRGDLIYIKKIDEIEQKTVLMDLHYVTAQEANRLISHVLSAKGGVEVNESANGLVITDFPAHITKIKQIVEKLDVPPVQVLIEAKIVDIQSKAFENLGTKLDVTYDPKGSGVGGGLFDRSSEADESFDIDTSLAGPSSTLSGGQIVLHPKFKSLDAKITIDALIQENKAHLLASPSIATLNGKEARIIIGEKFPYKEKTQTTTGTTETTRFVDVGTTLRVTPLVSPDGWITMNVHPEVSSVSAALEAGPRITTREADATIRVKNKQTIIIGGLINKKDDKLEGGVPFLRSIPVIGLLFSKRSKDVEETELTVFITPHIIESPKPLAGGSSSADDEVYLHLESIGDINLISKMYDRARRLEQGDIPEAAYKDSLAVKREALNTYKMIVSQFPQDANIDFCLYRMGRIYQKDLNEPQKAAEMFEKLINLYPDSRFKKKAEHALNKSKEELEENK